MNIPHWIINLSVFANHLTCGPIGYSLCARFYEGKRRGSKFHCLMVWIADKLFWFEPDHCRKAWLLRSR